MPFEKIVTVYIALIFLLIGCSSNNQQTTVHNRNEQNKPKSQQENDELEVIAENLDVPWSIERMNDTFYLTERSVSVILKELLGCLMEHYLLVSTETAPMMK